MKKISTIEEFNNFNEDYILKKLTSNKNRNIKLVENYFREFLFEVNSNNENLLQIFARSKSKYITSSIFYTLLELGVDPNQQNNQKLL